MCSFSQLSPITRREPWYQIERVDGTFHFGKVHYCTHIWEQEWEESGKWFAKYIVGEFVGNEVKTTPLMVSQGALFDYIANDTYNDDTNIYVSVYHHIYDDNCSECVIKRFIDSYYDDNGSTFYFQRRWDESLNKYVCHLKLKDQIFLSGTGHNSFTAFMKVCNDLYWELKVVDLFELEDDGTYYHPPNTMVDHVDMRAFCEVFDCTWDERDVDTVFLNTSMKYRRGSVTQLARAIARSPKLAGFLNLFASAPQPENLIPITNEE